MVEKFNWICWSKDYKNLSRSASGGVMYELAKYFINELKGVVVGVNLAGNFDIAFDLKTVENFQGSKYWKPHKLPFILYSLKRIDKPILFIGTPCQIQSAKNSLFNKDVFFVSLECHGFYHKEGVKRQGHHKLDGWSKSWYHLPKDYLNNKGLNSSCKNCVQKNVRGDLHISDAWDAPKHQINEYGTSRVKIITERGREVFNKLELHKEIEDTYQMRPKRIALLDVHDYHNFGNQLLSVNLMNEMYAEDKDIEFVFLEERASEAYKSIDEQVNAKVIYRTINLTREPMKRIIKDGIGLETIADCQSIIVLGGDCFSENSWHWKWLRYFLFFYLAQRKGHELFFFSNTIGNFPFYIRWFGKGILRRFKHIFVRDIWSFDQLKQLGCKNVSISPDLVYADMLEPSFKIQNPFTDYCVISPSLLWEKYGFKRHQYIEMCCNIHHHLKTISGLPILIIPHSSDNNARKLALDIAKRSGASCMFPSNATYARELLSKSRYNVCFRMHSALQGLRAGVPTCVVGYSKKYETQIENRYLSKPNSFAVEKVIKNTYDDIIYPPVGYIDLLRIQIKNLLSYIKEV